MSVQPVAPITLLDKIRLRPIDPFDPFDAIVLDVPLECFRIVWRGRLRGAWPGRRTRRQQLRERDAWRVECRDEAARGRGFARPRGLRPRFETIDRVQGFRRSYGAPKV